VKTDATPREKKWLAAFYHVPIMMSCRAPISSPETAQALPTPTPVTVQLALIRTAIERFGRSRTRDELFPHIVSCEPRIRPSKRIAISDQLLARSKVDSSGRSSLGIGYRQWVHCHGPFAVYVNVFPEMIKVFSALLQSVGYWGSADSLAVCLDARLEDPEPGSWMLPLEELPSSRIPEQTFIAFASTLNKSSASWEVITSPSLSSTSNGPISQRLFAWPLAICERRSDGTLLEYCSLLQ